MANIVIVATSRINGNRRSPIKRPQKCKPDLSLLIRILGYNEISFSCYFMYMKIRIPPTAAFLIFLATATVFYLAGVPRVPFHPDESTQLFTSSDAERFWRNPADLFWNPDREADPLQRYRELDAPLTRNLIALGRWIAGQDALPRDWNWSLTWEQNRQQRSLPSPSLLTAGRLAVASLFPFSVLLLYLATRKISGEAAAWVAALLLASNALVLLHTRRAMAESALIFTTTLFIWSLVQAERRPWLTGIPAALAFSAKQSLAALAPVGLLAALWTSPAAAQKKPLPRGLSTTRSALAWGALLAFVVAILHPFAWQQPYPAVLASIRARQALASAQVGDRPEQALDSPLKKLVAMAGGLYLVPPAFSETANYSAETRSAEEAYLANPLHSLFRSLPAGGLLIVLNLFGFVTACRKIFIVHSQIRRRMLLLLVASAVQTAALFVLVPLPWQRYYLPLVPFSCLWTAYGADQIIRLFRAGSGSPGPARRAAHLPEK